MQDRVGPNRVGPFGLLQPVADGIKFLFKEEITPSQVEKTLYWLAPALVLVPALLTFSVIPFGMSFFALGREISLQIADLQVGLLFIFALVSLAVYGSVLGGWAANSKYPLLGGLRASSQMISYELSLGMSIIGVLMLVGSLRLSDVVAYQSGSLFSILPRWNIFTQPLGFLIFLIASFAETNRLPFDLPETEPELVGGYHTEYSSMKFAMFFERVHGHPVLRRMGAVSVQHAARMGLARLDLQFTGIRCRSVPVCDLLRENRRLHPVLHVGSLDAGPAAI